MYEVLELNDINDFKEAHLKSKKIFIKRFNKCRKYNFKKVKILETKNGKLKRKLDECNKININGYDNFYLYFNDKDGVKIRMAIGGTVKMGGKFYIQGINCEPAYLYEEPK